MSIRVLKSFFVIIVVGGILLGGMTAAWFTSEVDTPSLAEMITGIVEFEVSEVEPEPENDRFIDWPSGECKDFAWSFKNNGSKKAFFRARPVVMTRVSETAWAEGARFNNKGSWAMYFPYTVGAPAKTVNLIAGQHHQAGAVTAWTENGHLHIQYETSGNWELTEIHLAVVRDLNQVPKVSGNPVPGQFPFKEETDTFVNTHTFVIPLSGTYPAGGLNGTDYTWHSGTRLYIAAQAVVFGETYILDGVNWQPAQNSGFTWTRGGAEDIDGAAVHWWYYCLPVPAGGEVTLSLDGCLNENAAKGIYSVHLAAESVQVTHGAVDNVWPQNPCSN